MVTNMWLTDKNFWKKALARALRSLAQGLLVGIGEVVVIQDVDWRLALGSGALMFVVSILTSIALGVPEYEEE